MATFWNNVRGTGKFIALFAVIGWSVAAYVIRRAHRCDAAAKARWLQLTCRRALRVLAVSVDSRGMPVERSVIVANHLSYMDVVVLAALTPVVFVSKKEVQSWPLFGWFAVQAGTLFIDRTCRGDVARIGTGLEAVIAAGLTTVLFLEGTTTDGRDVLSFKPSLLGPVVRNNWHVVPVALDYDVSANRSAAREVCWWGDMTLVPHLWNLTTLPWVRARVAWGGPVMALGQDRKEFAEDLRQRVVALRAGGALDVSHPH